MENIDKMFMKLPGTPQKKMFGSLDCKECKLFTGSMLVVFGLYVHIMIPEIPRRKIGRFTQALLGTGLIYLGFARMLEFPPFHNKLKDEK